MISAKRIAHTEFPSAVQKARLNQRFGADNTEVISTAAMGIKKIKLSMSATPPSHSGYAGLNT